MTPQHIAATVNGSSLGRAFLSGYCVIGVFVIAAHYHPLLPTLSTGLAGLQC